MKTQLIIFGIILFMSVLSKGQGWREGEMEVKITLSNPIEKEILYNLKLNGDIYNDYALLYVVPKELIKLKNTKLQYEVLKTDLNEYYKDFWQQKDAYHTYQEIIDLMDSLATHFSNICNKYEFGLSIQGRQLTALKISDNVNENEHEPEVLFDGGIHGDEIGAAENTIRFARKLCLEYGSDPEITELIDNREIWIYPMVNPDGRVNMVRYNAAGVDLNRDWGYMWDGWGGSSGAYSQVETKVLRDFINSNQFVIHTTYHSGMEGVLYTWCHRPDLTPDNDSHNFIAGLYSSSSGYSNLQYVQSYFDYPTNGELIDFTYGVNGSIGLTMEISTNKQPPPSQIMYYYEINVPSMIKMIEYSGYGLEGSITNANTGEPVSAVVFVNDYIPTYNDLEVGDYHKYVLPGTYSITVAANGYETQTIDNIIVTTGNTTVNEFQLLPVEGHYVYKFAGSQIPGNNFSDESNTPAVISEPDYINYSTGKNGWCILDMQYPVIDGPGFDIIVYEGDASPEGFICYAGETIDGPWISLGAGSGTTEFDLATSGLPEAQFIKIVDDGDGSANVADAGFDLDAIEAVALQALFYVSATEICEGETVDFFDMSTGGVISWEWEFEGGSPPSSSFPNPTVMYFNAGEYDVMLTVSDGVNFYSLTIEDYIIVNTCTNMNEGFDQLGIDISPNPSEGLITVRFNNVLCEVTLKVVNIQGKIIHESILKNIESESLNIDLNDTSDGVYFVQIITPKSKIIRKIIIH